ncbi:MAG: TldD/PmbA family protein [Gemmatimonadaceae bacterium]
MRPRSLFSATAAAENLMSEEQARSLTGRVLAMATADETRVSVENEWQGNTRFAGGEITTSGESTDTTVTVTSKIGRRRASTTTNVLEEDSLRRTVDLSERLARLSPEDPEIMPELAAQTFTPVSGFVDATANLGGDLRAAAAKQVIDRAAALGGAAGDLFVAGFLEANASARALANNRGLFAYHRSTDAELSTTVRTPDGTGSGWASAGARNWASIDPAALGARAAEKAVASRNPTAIEPGMYTVVLEPQAVASLIPLLGGAFNGRSADEGRSPFSKRGGGTRVGERIADERVTLYSDPADSDLLMAPFDNEGFPLTRRAWIENGVLKNLTYTRFWAQKQGVEPTGTGGGFGGGGFPGGLKMAGGTKSLDELIAGTQRGILITRLWYIRSLDTRTVMLTGLTRDGTFLIENGRVTRSLKNFRWNESPLFMLNKIDEIGRAEPTAAGQVMPSLKARDFNFTSLSEAV